MMNRSVKAALSLSAAAASLTLAGAYGTYRYIFHSPAGRQNDDYDLPQTVRDASYAAQAAEMIEKLRALPYERVSIVSFDGLKLCGRYYHERDGAPLVLMCHGYRGTPTRDFAGGAALFRSLGYNVLLIEQRAHASSGGHTITFGINERRDCLAWCRYAARRFQAPILLVGISMGAATVLMASALGLPENVRGIVADCPFTSPEAIIRKVGQDSGLPLSLILPFARLGAWLFGGFSLRADADAAQAVRHARVPVLLIHGDADDYVPIEMSREIAAANPERVEFHAFPGAWHGVSCLTDPERYARLVRDFCARIFPDNGT